MKHPKTFRRTTSDRRQLGSALVYCIGFAAIVAGVAALLMKRVDNLVDLQSRIKGLPTIEATVDIEGVKALLRTELDCFHSWVGMPKDAMNCAYGAAGKSYPIPLLSYQKTGSKHNVLAGSDHSKPTQIDGVPVRAFCKSGGGGNIAIEYQDGGAWKPLFKNPTPSRACPWPRDWME